MGHTGSTPFALLCNPSGRVQLVGANLSSLEGHVRDTHVVVVGREPHEWVQCLSLSHAQQMELGSAAEAQDRMRKLEALGLSGEQEHGIKDRHEERIVSSGDGTSSPQRVIVSQATISVTCTRETPPKRTRLPRG